MRRSDIHMAAPLSMRSFDRREPASGHRPFPLIVTSRFRSFAMSGLLYGSRVGPRIDLRWRLSASVD